MHQLVGTLLKDDQGKVTAIVATGWDVTGQKEEQRATKRKDDDLMLVIESGKPMYYTHTPDHMMQFVSPRLRALLGCTPNAKKRLWTDYLSDNPINAQGLERTLRAIASGPLANPVCRNFWGPITPGDMGGSERDSHRKKRQGCGDCRC